MGVYRAIHADHVSIRLVHEPETTESETIEIRNPGVFFRSQFTAGKRYILYFQAGEYNTTPPADQIAAAEADAPPAGETLSEVTEATEKPAVEAEPQEVVDAISASAEATEKA